MMPIFVSNDSHASLLTYVGAVVIFVWCSKVFCSIFGTLYSTILGYFELNVSWKKMGKWAVVTGATDGMGKCYAEELAHRGFSIVLVSRNQEKLDLVAEHIRNLYSVDTKVICVDFADGPEIYDKIRDEIESLEIGVLVNNVGMSYDYTEYFHEIPDGRKVMDKLIDVNIVSCTMMTRLILPQMEERKKGVIINMSSLVALAPVPLLAGYAACKAYVDYFTRSIHVEYKDKGIIIQSVRPAFVVTKMSKIKRTSLQVPLPKTYVCSAIKTVGTESYTYGYLPHKIRGYIHELLKEYMPDIVSTWIAFSTTSKTRERYFRKLAKSK